MKLPDVNVWLAAALTRRAAWDLVDRVLADPRVQFLVEPDTLAAFALAAGAEIVTLDRPFRARYPSVRVVLLG